MPINSEDLLFLHEHCNIADLSSFDQVFTSLSGVSTFEDKMDILAKEAETKKKQTHVVVVGAGPAGLVRAIYSLLNGNPTLIIEKRSQNAPARENALLLEKSVVVNVLIELGIYEYLIENQLVHPSAMPLKLIVRICDLEKAMKAVIDRLSPNKDIVVFNAEVQKIEVIENKARLTIHKRDTPTGKITLTPDLLVIADGAHSSTSRLLGIQRICVAPKICFLAAIFEKAPLWKIGNIFQQLPSFFRSVRAYYKKEVKGRFVFSVSEIKGAAILSTPNQHYVFLLLNKKTKNEFFYYYNNYKNCKDRLSRELPFEEQLVFQKELSNAKRKYEKNLKKWIHLAFHYGFHRKRIQWMKWKILKQNFLIESEIDYANYCAGNLGNSVYVLAGDALATSDPTTACGCQAALISSVSFIDLLKEIDDILNEPQYFSHEKISCALEKYRFAADQLIKKLHSLSIRLRESFNGENP